ncbi:MAG: TetR/AcrR family transcriptional regulator [Deltaproteobacteria bacterium]|nr:TetR/AcrR family transcriptional regulator [Deltaproteobacteria bacterium]
MRPERQMDTKEKILVGAKRLLLKKGQQGFTVRGVAEEAGVNHGLVHHYFGSKENMILEMIEYENCAIMPLLRQPEKTEDHEAFKEKFVQNVVKDPDKVRMIVEFYNMGQSLPAVREKLKESIIKRREMMSQVFGITDEVDKKLFQALFFGSIMQTHVDDSVDFLQSLKRLMEIFCCGGQSKKD